MAWHRFLFFSFWFYREICGLMLRYRTTSVYGPRLGELSDWT